MSTPSPLPPTQITFLPRIFHHFVRIIVFHHTFRFLFCASSQVKEILRLFVFFTICEQIFKMQKMSLRFLVIAKSTFFLFYYIICEKCFFFQHE